MGRDLCIVWRTFAGTFRGAGMKVLGRVLVFFVLSGVVLFPLDLVILEWVRSPDIGGLERAEEFLDFWGDFLPFNVGITAVLLAVGWMRRDPWVRRAAFAFLLAGILSGATARLFKFSTGRARPSAVEDRARHWVSFEGPSLKASYHGYFSGHTAATWGSATAIFILCPRFGGIALLFAGAVGWSRLYGNHHFPSDVAHGAACGVAWGWLVARDLALLKKRRQLDDPRATHPRRGPRPPT